MIHFTCFYNMEADWMEAW